MIHLSFHSVLVVGRWSVTLNTSRWVRPSRRVTNGWQAGGSFVTGRPGSLVGPDAVLLMVETIWSVGWWQVATTRKTQAGIDHDRQLLEWLESDAPQ